MAPLYDVAIACRESPELADFVARTLTASLAAQLAGEIIPPDVPADAWREWQQHFRAHLARYGHTTYRLIGAFGC